MILDWLVIVCFGIVTVNFFLIGVLFYQSQNGLLRVCMYRFCFALTWAAGLRSAEPYLEAYIDNNKIALAVGLPVVVTGLLLVRYLHVTYKVKK
jgi:hypothetical protein